MNTDREQESYQCSSVFIRGQKPHHGPSTLRRRPSILKVRRWPEAIHHISSRTWSSAMAPGAGVGGASKGVICATHPATNRSEEHTSELQSLRHLVCRLLLEKKKTTHTYSRFWVSRAGARPHSTHSSTE